VECHRRKVRCDRNLPCGRCIDGDIRCIYERDEKVQPMVSSARTKATDIHKSTTQSSVTVVGQVESSQTADQITEQPVRGIMSKARLLGSTHPIGTYRQVSTFFAV
jgi:hypothetical protein